MQRGGNRTGAPFLCLCAPCSPLARKDASGRGALQVHAMGPLRWATLQTLSAHAPPTCVLSQQPAGLQQVKPVLHVEVLGAVLRMAPRCFLYLAHEACVSTRCTMLRGSVGIGSGRVHARVAPISTYAMQAARLRGP